MSTPRQVHTPATPPRAAAGRGKKDKGTRGGRPEPTAAAARPAGGRGTAARLPGQQGAAAERRGRAGAGEQDGTAAESAAPATRVPLWLWLSTLLVSIAGLADSTYLTIAHFTSPSILACSDTGVVNCSLVTTSAESELFGHIPVAVLGLAFFVFMTAVNTPWGWRLRWPAVHRVRLGSVIVGMVFVLYLVYAELITLDHICLYCTYVHILTFALFVIVVYSSAAGYGIRRAAAGRPA